jgi:hypothetical protein
MRAKKAEVTLREGTDIVKFELCFFSEVVKGLRMQLEVSKNQGIQYCIDRFGVFPNIINTRN